MGILRFLKKGFSFVKRYFLKDPLFVFMYGIAYFQKNYSTGVRFYSTGEFFGELEKNKSLIRIGDGEIGMLHGLDIYYQKYDTGLVESMRRIIHEYKGESPYVLSIPAFAGYSNTELCKIKNKLRCWLPLKVEFRKSFNKNMKYADAHIFYHKERMKAFFSKFVENKDIIFVTNQEAASKIAACNLNFNSTQFVITPDTNSFDGVENIHAKLDTILANNTKAKIIFSCGPAGKSMAFKYSGEGRVCYDIGFGIRYLYDDTDYSPVI